jgi:hypothetical protein
MTRYTITGMRAGWCLAAVLTVALPGGCAEPPPPPWTGATCPELTAFGPERQGSLILDQQTAQGLWVQCRYGDPPYQGGSPDYLVEYRIGERRATLEKVTWHYDNDDDAKWPYVELPGAGVYAVAVIQELYVGVNVWSENALVTVVQPGRGVTRRSLAARVPEYTALANDVLAGLHR